MKVFHDVKGGLKYLWKNQMLRNRLEFTTKRSIRDMQCIFEKNYGITVSKLRLGISHPSYNKC